jgi:hypothetical protein
MLLAPVLVPVAAPAPAGVTEPPVVADDGPQAGEAAAVIRVERGSVSAEELAAVTAVLLARAAAVRAVAGAQAPSGVRRAAARWRVHGFAGPRAWTTDARDLLAS